MSRKKEKLTKREKEIYKSFRLTKVIWPILIGVLVILYLLWQQFDPVAFRRIDWTFHTLFWLFMAILILACRHLAYAYRLMVLSDREFSLRKCIQLIFIWEFASAVSPTSVGGSAVALLVISQEKLGPAKTTTIVVYTIILDTMFFIFTLPILLSVLGLDIIRPGLTAWGDLDAWGGLFLTAYILMFSYGCLFFYGLFINPRPVKRLLILITRIRFLRRYRRKAVRLGDDIITIARELPQKPWKYHVKALLATVVAWSFRFLVLSAVIIAIVEVPPLKVWPQLELYARLQSMYVIMAFSPTPGGSGFAEFVFGGFLTDYVPVGIALVVAFIWRILAYYSYLIAGVIVVPQWFNRILRKRRLKKRSGKAEPRQE